MSNTVDYVVGIGASAGGLEALERLFANMPADTGIAFVVIQHLSPNHKSRMDELLARRTKMTICSVEDITPLAPNTVYLMAPKTELAVNDGQLVPKARDPKLGVTLPIDQFFRSLALDFGGRAVAVVLSGTGSDGSAGLRHVHDAGGLVVAQREDTAAFDGMPRSAIDTGLTDLSLPPEEIPAAIVSHVERARRVEESAETPVSSDAMSGVFELLRNAYKIDFAHYKASTISRRTERRLFMSRRANLDDYLDQLRTDEEELDRLYRDLLIGVTRFFRDAEAYERLEQKAIPEIVANIPDGRELRAWVAGCATGEEAYSLAMLIDEQLRAQNRRLAVKIFATDVHPRCLQTASAGIYSRDEVGALPVARVSRYFRPHSDGFEIAPSLRRMVVFARHNVIKDAPFTRLDFISCRNLLIYLRSPAQHKALTLMHFGLRVGGVLMLGPSESPGELADEFDAVDSRWKLYRKRRDVRLASPLRVGGVDSAPATGFGAKARRPFDQTLAAAFASLLESLVPDGFVVDEQRALVHTFGEGARYFKFPSGKPSLDVLELLDGDLKLAVAGAIHRASRDGEVVKFPRVRASSDPDAPLLDVSVTPLMPERAAGPYALVTVGEVKTSSEAPRPEMDLQEASRSRVEELERDLRHTRENLQATIEELETSNEELQATNEELLATNEELHSANEELQSVNEELHTVNAEYQNKIAELTELNADVDHLLSSADVHTLFLDRDLRIRKFTPRMSEVFNLLPQDTGRRIDSFVRNVDSPDLLTRLSAVLQTGEAQELETRAGNEHYLMRIVPYRNTAQPEGVVVTMISITQHKLTEELFRQAVEASPTGMLVVDTHGYIVLANAQVAAIFGYERDELVDMEVERLVPARRRDRHRKSRASFAQAPSPRAMGRELDLVGLRKDGSTIPLDITLAPVGGAGRATVLATVMPLDERDQRRYRTLRAAVQQRDRFLATLSHELRNPLGAIMNAANLLAIRGDEADIVARVAEIVKRQGEHMGHLLGELLDVARVAQGKIRLDRAVCDLRTLARDAHESVLPLVMKHNHIVRLDLADEPVWVDVDAARVRQVLANLLANAAKYTPDGGDIRVEIAFQGEEAIARVRDNGRGIPPDRLEEVFEIFAQSEDTLDRSDGGIGLGLTLARTLVNLHGGTLRAHSEGLGHGSEFVLTLALSPPPGATDEPEHAPARHTRPLRLVIVEDNRDAREALVLMLGETGHTVMAESDGETGLDLILRERPDVALIDIGLPKLNGYQVARRARAELGKQIHLIAVTGYGRESDQVAVEEAGFDTHLIKPLEMDALERELANVAAARAPA